MINEEQLTHGGLESPKDERDFQWSEIGSAGQPFDWEKGFDVEDKVKLKVKNQYGSFSCGGQCFAYYGEVLEALATGTQEERSAKFLYSQVFVPAGGSDGRSLSNLAIKKGWAKESLLPSQDNGTCTEDFMRRVSDITEDVLKDAGTAKALSYANVNFDIDSIAQAIRDNNGLALLFRGENNGSWTTEFPKVTQIGAWNHWCYCTSAKLINGRKFIRIINSWGNVGDNGRQYLSEEFFPKWIYGAWTLFYNKPEIVKHNYTFLFDLYYGQNSLEIKFLQDLLKEKGFLDIRIPSTGYYGENTRLAVYNYQIANKVAEKVVLDALMGRKVGPATRNSLNS